jgi:CHASE3 domain sensor protein
VRPATRQMALIVLLLAAVLGLFVAAVSGQRQLEEASQQVEEDALRGRALADVLQLLSRAESAQRGFILLGDATYLEPFGNPPRASRTYCASSTRCLRLHGRRCAPRSGRSSA